MMNGNDETLVPIDMGRCSKNDTGRLEKLFGRHYGANVELKIWSADFVQLFELLECLNWKISGTQHFQVLDACRVVVNVYKHGEGKSLDDLRQKYPEYLDNPFGDSAGILSGVQHCDHTRLKVNETQFQAFSDAIVAFWMAIPENTFASKVGSVPGWFEKAAGKDRLAQQKSGNK